MRDHALGERRPWFRPFIKEPDFPEMFMSYLLSRDSRIEEDLIDQLFNSSEKRLARRLLLTPGQLWQGRQSGADRGKIQSGNAGGNDRHDPIARELFLNKFRKLGFIEYNGKLEVHNSLLNVVLYDKLEIATKDEAIIAE